MLLKFILPLNSEKLYGRAVNTETAMVFPFQLSQQSYMPKKTHFYKKPSNIVNIYFFRRRGACHIVDLALPHYWKTAEKGKTGEMEVNMGWISHVTTQSAYQILHLIFSIYILKTTQDDCVNCRCVLI